MSQVWGTGGRPAGRCRAAHEQMSRLLEPLYSYLLGCTEIQTFDDWRRSAQANFRCQTRSESLPTRYKDVYTNTPIYHLYCGYQNILRFTCLYWKNTRSSPVQILYDQTPIWIGKTYILNNCISCTYTCVSLISVNEITRVNMNLLTNNTI